MGRALIGILLLALAGPTLAKTNDWTVGCDNGRACHASSLTPPASDASEWTTMHVKRGAEANAPPLIVIVTTLEPTRLRREGGGGTVRLIRRMRNANEQALSLMSHKFDYQVDSRDLKTAIAALRRDSRLVVEDARRRPVGEISLKGASAALLYMDDIQKRVNTVTALVRRGPKSGTTMPAPPSLPIVRSAAKNIPLPFRISATRIAALRKEIGEECDFEPSFIRSHFEESQSALDRSRTLLLIECAGGAYNSFHFVFVATKRGGRISIAEARFVPPEGSPPMLTRAVWNAQQGLLSSSFLGRGLGDCGEITHYVWDGRSFRRSEKREMNSECRGSRDFITTWRARVVR